MAYQPIQNYGIIGNMRTVALVGLNGSNRIGCATIGSSRTRGSGRFLGATTLRLFEGHVLGGLRPRPPLG